MSTPTKYFELEISFAWRLTKARCESTIMHINISYTDEKGFMWHQLHCSILMSTLISLNVYQLEVAWTMIAKYVDHLINFDPIDSSAFSNLTLKVVISDMIGLWDHWHFSTLSPPPPPNRHSSINFAPVHIFYCATKSNQKIFPRRLL